jgi:shikimate dehydrogenase
MTIKAGVIGDPISHSLSPKLHNYFLQKYNINGQYSAINIKPENFEKDFDDLLFNQDFAGFNITLPHKEKAFELCKKRGYAITNAAKITKAVNTIYKENGEICAASTDSIGFFENLKLCAKKTNFEKSALIIGAGGAASSILFSLLIDTKINGKIYIINRNRERALQLKNHYDASILLGLNPTKIEIIDEVTQEIAKNLDLVVNTTSLGMKNQPELEIDFTNLNKNSVVCDIVYNPLMTKLLQDAKNRNNQIVTGIGMLIFQALFGFEKWFKIKPQLENQDLEKLQMILK